MKDFTVAAAPRLEFKIDEDTFYATGVCPGGLVTDLGMLAGSDDNVESLRMVMEFMDKVLLPESAELFVSRLRDSGHPITFTQAIAVFTWLVEEYSGSARPTQAPSLLPEPSGSDTTISTGSAPSADSIPKPALSVASST